MSEFVVNKSYQEINQKIKNGDVVVATAEEMIGIVKEKGSVEAAKKVDVVTTGTFAPMCSSGAFINFGHSKPGVKASKVWFNNVPAYAGIAAVDCYIGATEPCEDDPLNKVYPGKFNYGGGHVIQDLIAGKEVQLKATAYGTDCYPGHSLEKMVRLDDLPQAILCNPRNGYQNYNVAVNKSKKTIYTYMGTLKPNFANANYCSAGELSPLFNDPYYKTIGTGTRVFIGGAAGYVTWHGTQHNPYVPRTEKGIPKGPAGTIFVMGDLKEMSPEWVVGVSIQGYGSSVSLGLGIPIPILNEEIAQFTAISDTDIFTNIIDYSEDYPNGTGVKLGSVSYAELKSGMITINDLQVPTVPLSSMKKSREVAATLKEWIKTGKFLIGEPQSTIPNGL